MAKTRSRRPCPVNGCRRLRSSDWPMCAPCYRGVSRFIKADVALAQERVARARTEDEQLDAADNWRRVVRAAVASAEDPA